MTLPATGSLSMSQINDEIGKYGTWANFWLSHADARALAGVPSGAISFSNFRGKSTYVPMSASSSGVDYWEPYPNTTGIRSYGTDCELSLYNGKGTFSFQWAWQAGGGGITLSNATSQNCRVAMSTRFGTSGTGTLQCTITDAYNGSTYTLYNIPVSIVVGERV